MDKYFRVGMIGRAYYVKTDKKIVNKTDINRLLELMAKENNIDLAKCPEIAIKSTLNQIKNAMELCEISIKNNMVKYTAKYSGGIGETIIENKNNYIITA